MHSVYLDATISYLKNPSIITDTTAKSRDNGVKLFTLTFVPTASLQCNCMQILYTNHLVLCIHR